MTKIFNIIINPYKKEAFNLTYFDCKKLAFNTKYLIFFKHESFNTFTFYNGFFIDKWRQNTTLDNLSLTIRGKGRIKLSVIYCARDFNKEFIFHDEYDLSDEFFLLIHDFNRWEDGCIFFDIMPLEDGYISEAFYSTNTPIKHDVTLGIAITHFNRIDAVQSSIKRLNENLFTDEILNKKIFLKLIDNSKNSGVVNNQNVEVIPNQNLGGSGGFTRGLLEMDLDGSYTHCLFMDDDASCEAESIKRTYYLLSFAKDDNLAVSGALLLDNKPDRIWEKGACLNSKWTPLHHLLKLKNCSRALFDVEQLDPNDNTYGAWWFFAFNIKCIKNYPFPFFVKGDDAMFSLVNPFNIMTINGVCCYGESFLTKDGVMPRYLGLRCSLLIFTLLNKTLATKINIILKTVVSNLFSYSYASVKMSLNAINDYMQGPTFWDKNKDMQKIFPIIKELSKSETATFEAFNYNDLIYKNMHESKLRKYWRIITLNGMLIPSFLFHKGTVFQPKGGRANFREVFLYKNIRYVNDADQKSYVATVSKKEFFCLSWRLLKTLCKLIKNNKKIENDYKENAAKMMTKEYWMNIYYKNDDKEE